MLFIQWMFKQNIKILKKKKKKDIKTLKVLFQQIQPILYFNIPI